MRGHLLVFLALALSACMRPDVQRPAVYGAEVTAERARLAEQAVRFQDAEARRLTAIAWPIMTANAELCPRRTHMPGFRLTSHHEYSRELRGAAREHLDVEHRPRLQMVVAQSPAEAAGLRAGDRVEAIDSRATGPRARDWRRSLHHLERSARDGLVRLTIRRDGALMEYEIELRPACSYAIEIQRSPVVNAFADGERIVILEGLIDFALNDEEIAFILAHELAHNVERHVQASQWNALAGGAAGLLIDVALASAGLNTGAVFAEAGMRVGAEAYSPEFEAEADYLSLYYLARAGIPLDGVEAFWRRMADRHPEGVTRTTTHPSYPERTVNIIATRQEIEAKIAAGEPLIPERRKSNFDRNRSDEHRALDGG
ncbi:MAG: M48 family metallopeptidase [Pseudomonadota bacterium]